MIIKRFAVHSYTQTFFTIGTFYSRFIYFYRNWFTWRREKMTFRCICYKTVTLETVQWFYYCIFKFADYLILIFTTFTRSGIICKVGKFRAILRPKQINLYWGGENLIWNLGVYCIKPIIKQKKKLKQEIITKIIIVRGCHRYIFASLFFTSKREHLWNKEKRFLFHFESSFRLSDNQVSTFQMLLNNLGSKHSLVIKFCQFM